MTRTVLLILLLCFHFSASAAETSPLEFDTGRPRPPKAGFPILGSGLALSEGVYRGVSFGELSGWTFSLWFQAHSEKRGEIFNVVMDEKAGKAVRIIHEGKSLRFQIPPARRGAPLRTLEASEDLNLNTWHHLVITYKDGPGPALYLDGKHIAQGGRGWLGYATSFANYHFGAGIRPDGKFVNFFDGLIDDFALYERPLDADEIQRLFSGETIKEDLVTFNDFENVNHQDLAFFSASDRDEKFLDEGRQLYQVNCSQCHSKDGVSPPLNPMSRAFTKHPMEAGGDPFSMFQTVTYGFRHMMPAVQLNPEDRYKVIHFIREKMIREMAPDLYVAVDENYTDVMPRSPEGSGEEVARIAALARTGYLRDYGKALISPLRFGSWKTSSPNALTIDLGNELTISYDLGTMRSLGSWQGGFLDFENTLHHKLRAPGLPTPEAFQHLPQSGQWRWAWDGTAENEVPDISPLTNWPSDQINYRGHYSHGNEIVISYTVQGRGVLESPVGELVDDSPVIHRRLSIEAGERPLEIVVFDENETPLAINENKVTSGKQSATLHANDDAAKWRVGSSGSLVLRIPASKEPLHFDVALSAQDVTSTNLTRDLTPLTGGGPSRWETNHEMQGRLAVSTFQGYALDSVPVPLKNDYNTWMRTSCLTFFPDGRLAVGTLSGDIWIVSGIDKSLEQVTWKRFAAGLYEPMGMKVVNGILTVGTRGRIVKLHDLNEDGEADFYEAFFNEPEPAPGWHAYNFDLEVGGDGSYYYARVGGFSKWSIPGGMVRVAPDGRSWEVVGAGMRVPNGIGLLPDGRATFSDNQGTFVPASKISITRKGDFHGAGNWKDRDGDWNPDKIVPPILYMPQELDSSSGAQLWVEKDERFGPLSGSYFHTSYGRAKTILLLLDELENGVTQAAAFPLPLTMESGTMRIAKNPVDGQLYTSGLTGWQAGASREGSIQRIRYTGEEGLYLTGAKARKGRLELTFNQAVDPDAISEINQWNVTAWNYRWSQGYGSPHFKISEPETEGIDEWTIEGVKPRDPNTLTVELPDLQPCDTLKLDFQIGELSGPLYFTIHELPAN